MLNFCPVHPSLHGWGEGGYPALCSVQARLCLSTCFFAVSGTYFPPYAMLFRMVEGMVKYWSCCSPAEAVFSLVSASTGWKTCNLTTYRLYNQCRSRHECAPSCRHMGILRLNRKISTDVRKSNSVSELLWSQLSSVSTNWTSEPPLYPSPAVVCVPFPRLAFSLSASLPQNRREALPQKGSRYGKMLIYSDIMAMEAIKGLQKKMKDIFLVVLFSIKCF